MVFPEFGLSDEIESQLKSLTESALQGVIGSTQIYKMRERLLVGSGLVHLFKPAN